MNREQVKDILPIIQAYADGKEIQFLSHKDRETWYSVGNLTLTEGSQYRIKPEPRVIYVNELSNGDLSSVNWDSPGPCKDKPIKFIEVIDD